MENRLITFCKNNINNNIEQIKHLLENGENPDKQDKYENTCLIYACLNNNSTLIDLLLYYNANINIKNNEGESALHISCRRKNYLITRELIKKCCALNVQNNKGLTPLMIVCKLGHLMIAELLLEQDDTLINIKDNKGETAFILACKYGWKDIVLLLLKYNCDITIKNNDGDDILTMLLKYYISPKSGTYIDDRYIECYYVDIFKIILKHNFVDNIDTLLHNSKNSEISNLLINYYI